MILHHHRATAWLLVRDGAGVWRRSLPRRGQLGRCGWRRWLRGGRRAGLVQQAHHQHLVDIRVHPRRVRRTGPHLVPQHQSEQRVQHQGQRQRERPLPACQRRRLSPTPAPQGLACTDVERCQTACAILLGGMSDLPGTFDETASFKRNTQTKLAHAGGMAVFRAIPVDRFSRAGFPRWQKWRLALSVSTVLPRPPSAPRRRLRASPHGPQSAHGPDRCEG